MATLYLWLYFENIVTICFSKNTMISDYVGGWICFTKVIINDFVIFEKNILISPGNFRRQKCDSASVQSAGLHFHKLISFNIFFCENYSATPSAYGKCFLGTIREVCKRDWSRVHTIYRYYKSSYSRSQISFLDLKEKSYF